MPVHDRNSFESLYTTQPRWEIRRPQKALLDVADQIAGSVLDSGCGTGGLDWKSGTLWFFPNHDVLYPFPRRTLPIVPHDLLIRLSYPGNPLASSVMMPVLHV